MTAEKKLAFEYFLWKIFIWQKEENQGKSNDLSKLKIFKLHFFTSAVNSSSNNDGLLDLFDKFYALPYGPVESDIYNELDGFGNFKIDSNMMEVRNNPSFDSSFNDIATRIDFSINTLKELSPNIINYSAFELVELSHRWRCWKMTFQLAKRSNKSSLQIPNELIKAELKQFVI